MDILRGAELPIGTVIRVGPHPDVLPAARNIEFRLIQPAIWRHGENVRAQPVVKNPNGWSHKTVTHDFNLEYDKIVLYGEENKQLGKSLLERIDD